MNKEEKGKVGERIKEILEVVAAIISLGMVVYLGKSLITETIYRNDKEIDFSTNVYINSNDVSYEKMKELVEDGNIEIIMRMTFSNSTRYALTISDIKVEVFDKDANGEYKGTMETRPRLLERDSDVDNNELDRNVYFLTIPSGEARDAYFVYQAPLSDDEKMQLLKIANETVNDYEAAFYRIVSDCIARTYEDYEGLFRVSYNQYGANEMDEKIKQCYSFEYNLNESSMPINATDINASLVVHRTELDDSALTKYTVYAPKLSTEYTGDLEKRIREQCGYFPERTNELDKIAYVENLGETNDKQVVSFETQVEIKKYTGHSITKSCYMSSVDRYPQTVDRFLKNFMEQIKQNSKESQYVGMNVYESEDGHCYITIVFSNEE